MHKQCRVAVIGSGTAGVTIARNLSKVARVDLYEQSVAQALPILNRIPLLIGPLFRSENEYVKKISLKFDSNREIPFFTPAVWGGSAMINGCVHVIGNEQLLAESFRPFGYDVTDVKREVEALYTQSREKSKINIKSAPQDELDLAFAKAAENMGLRKGKSYWNAPNTWGAIYNTVGGFFRSTGCDLPLPENVTKHHGLAVQGIALKGQSEVMGIIVNKQLKSYDKVVICGGVIGTNRLLQQPFWREDLQAYEQSRFKSEGKIADHTNLRVNVKTRRKVLSLNRLQVSVYQKVKMVVAAALGSRTLLQGTGATSAMHLDLDNDGVADVRLNLLRFYEDGRGGGKHRYFDSDSPGFSISITPMNPKSRGSIGHDVNPNYLEHSNDLDILIKALNFVIELLDCPELSCYVDEIIDLDQIKIDPQSYIRKNIYSGYHLIGGASEYLDCSLEIKNFDNLFVCDASVFETFPGSNINAAVNILASLFSKKLSRMIFDGETHGV